MVITITILSPTIYVVREFELLQRLQENHVDKRASPTTTNIPHQAPLDHEIHLRTDETKSSRLNVCTAVSQILNLDIMRPRLPTSIAKNLKSVSDNLLSAEIKNNLIHLRLSEIVSTFYILVATFDEFNKRQ